MVEEAKAVRTSDYKQVRQSISGYAIGYRRVDCWKVAVRIGRRWFHSHEKYATQASAARAAKRITDRAGGKGNE